jgi:RNA polymerase sigma-70 factor, ECF subfamily
VLRVAIHLTGSHEDAQDIYQDAFLRAYINLPSFRFECSFYTWIYRIVTNLCLDHLRKKNLRGRDVTTIVSQDGEEEAVLNRVSDHRPGASPERSLVGRELRRCILHALGRLSSRERMVFELKHYHGLKLRTVAGILNTTEGTIKNTLYRATQKLRNQLAEVR